MKATAMYHTEPSNMIWQVGILHSSYCGRACVQTPAHLLTSMHVKARAYCKPPPSSLYLSFAHHLLHTLLCTPHFFVLTFTNTAFSFCAHYTTPLRNLRTRSQGSSQDVRRMLLAEADLLPYVG